MGMTINATFYESWIRTIGSLPMRLMSVAILELDAVGEHELAIELMRVREKWAQTVSRRAKDAASPERLRHVAQVLEQSMLGNDRPKAVLTFPAARDARREPYPMRRLEVVDAD